MSESKERFTFEISLSVLNHLGRNLYRSFTTVLGEAISNSWDADAKNVWIHIDRNRDCFYVKDDGIGMTSDDFQNKFLKIGYSKRKDGTRESGDGRPFIGRKGIGKLALLSCAEKITVISKVKGGDYVGGVIDNSSLDEAITDDLTPSEYLLGEWADDMFLEQIEDHEKGTIIYFENVRDGIRNRINYLRKIIALYFRFSLIDEDFNIYINGNPINLENLRDLIDKTEFLWNINDHDDPYVDLIREKFTPKNNEEKQFNVSFDIYGFIASVELPRHLKVLSTDERVSVDLFVNGRLRERDILKHIPTARIVESYVYGQIHFDELDDDEEDRFTSSREGIVADDLKFKSLLAILRNEIMPIIIKDWDDWRRKHKKDGDPENLEIPSKERKAEELYNVVSDEYIPPEGAEHRNKVDNWVSDLFEDAVFNFVSYADCFISENLIRNFILDTGNTITPRARSEINKLRNKEVANKQSGNININLRKDDDDLSYLDMDHLAHLVDDPGTMNSLAFDAKQYKPIRDAVMHTARLTNEAKLKLRSVYDNIKARVKILLSQVFSV